MKKSCCSILVAGGLLISAGLYAPAMGDAQVQINVDIPLPQLFIPAPPPLIPIPGVNVYYPPDVDVDVFFYHDRWYRPHHGKWYRAQNYNGPWHKVRHEHVPGSVRGVPRSFRHSPHRYERISYEKVRRNHRAWERDRHWDRHERRTNRHRAVEKDRHGDRHERRVHNDRVMKTDHRRDRPEGREHEEQQKNYSHNGKKR